MILISLLILGAAAAGSATSGKSVGLDVIGSDTNSTTIDSPYGAPVEVDIIGSTANNIRIGYPVEEANNTCCDYCGRQKCYITPWDDYRRNLCYPWSSYIPTRYMRPIYIRDQDNSSSKLIVLGG
ncbi:Uncharacterised protein [uncultured archaeon]|nr:Uncharacterised protein [uncultured archaeon]